MTTQWAQRRGWRGSSTRQGQAAACTSHTSVGRAVGCGREQLAPCTADPQAHRKTPEHKTQDTSTLKSAPSWHGGPFGAPGRAPPPPSPAWGPCGGRGRHLGGRLAGARRGSGARATPAGSAGAASPLPQGPAGPGRRRRAPCGAVPPARPGSSPSSASSTLGVSPSSEGGCSLPSHLRLPGADRGTGPPISTGFRQPGCLCSSDTPADLDLQTNPSTARELLGHLCFLLRFSVSVISL